MLGQTPQPYGPAFEVRLNSLLWSLRTADREVEGLDILARICLASL